MSFVFNLFISFLNKYRIQNSIASRQIRTHGTDDVRTVIMTSEPRTKDCFPNTTRDVPQEIVEF